MKKLLLSFLLLSFAFSVQAQNTKPTKEQTIEYILNTLKDYSSDFNMSTTGSNPCTQTITDIFFNDYLLTVKYSLVYHEMKVSHSGQILINLKEMERIVLDNSSNVFWLFFYSYNSKKLIKSDNTSVIDGNKKFETAYHVKYSIPAPNDEKLVKAFNHLRKLCGAPEPLKF